MPEFPATNRSDIAFSIRTHRTYLDTPHLERVAQILDEIGPWSRDASMYTSHLKGLRAFFTYVGKLPTRTVLAVGEGTTRAISEIDQTDWVQGNNITIEPTVLSYHPIIRRFWQKALHVTSVESLRGVKDNSIAGVLGCHSIRYSNYPQEVVDSLRRVLIPGGIGKFSIKEDLLPAYEKALKDDFEVSKLTYTFGQEQSQKTPIIILLIKKLGGTDPTSTEDLLQQDLQTVREQLLELRTPTKHAKSNNVTD